MRGMIKKGFTIIEVSLFLAVTGLLLFGMIAGVQGSIYQQRYNDSVQSFVEFLRGAYSQTMNVQNPVGGGNSMDEIIYGKLLVFGQGKDFNGNNIDLGRSVFSYTVVSGDYDETSDIKGILAGKDVYIRKTSDNSFYVMAEQYIPKWDTQIQVTGKGNMNPFKGSVLILRHPQGGNVMTYYSSDVINANNGTSKINVGSFVEGEIDFCVNPEGNASGARRNVRIAKGAMNASGVELIAQDSGDNKCEK